MSQQNAFKPMDLVQNPDGEIFFIDQKKPGDFPNIYWAISLERPELHIQTVSDQEARRLCSPEDLPTAVEALLGFRAEFGRGDHSLGGFESKIINVIDKLQTILANKDE
jgi:hypothetical protein